MPPEYRERVDAFLSTDGNASEAARMLGFTSRTGYTNIRRAVDHFLHVMYRRDGRGQPVAWV
jgi:hypothetical protein